MLKTISIYNFVNNQNTMSILLCQIAEILLNPLDLFAHDIQTRGKMNTSSPLEQHHAELYH